MMEILCAALAVFVAAATGLLCGFGTLGMIFCAVWVKRWSQRPTPYLLDVPGALDLLESVEEKAAQLLVVLDRQNDTLGSVLEQEALTDRVASLERQCADSATLCGGCDTFPMCSPVTVAEAVVDWPTEEGEGGSEKTH